MATDAPAPANFSAIARPMPSLPPVMSAVRPVIDICMFLVPRSEMSVETGLLDSCGPAQCGSWKPRSTDDGMVRRGFRRDPPVEPRVGFALDTPAHRAETA